jgi:hypothetical protein
MPEITIREDLWNDIKSIARRKRESPSEFAQSVLEDYLQMLADDDLLERSRRSAQALNLRTRDAESLVRKIRNRAGK